MFTTEKEIREAIDNNTLEKNQIQLENISAELATDIMLYFYYQKEDYDTAFLYGEIAYNLDSKNELYSMNLYYCQQKVFPNKEKPNNKICVYAICKNELQFVDKWLESMQEADYIVVLDTGSTDGTYEKLKNDPRVYRCEQKVYKPWRFDIPRNDSMAMAPEDANILISTDLDEILEPGWADILREQWNPQYHWRGIYKYAWAHNDSGKNENTFWYDKIHTKDYYWEYPVHEALKRYDGKSDAAHQLYLDDRFFLHHYPDWTKSRGSYLPLLELRMQEHPDDFYGRFYLAREYGFHKQFDKAIETYQMVIDNPNLVKDDLSVLCASYYNLGEIYEELNQENEALRYYFDSLEADSTYREPYLKIAQIMINKGLDQAGIIFVYTALEKCYRHYSWLERKSMWAERPYDLLGWAFSNIGEYKKSEENYLKALEYNPTDKRLQENLAYTRSQMK